MIVITLTCSLGAQEESVVPQSGLLNLLSDSVLALI